MKRIKNGKIKMKIIFLDIDGVINTLESYKKRVYVENKLLHNLERIIEETDAKVVISSSWRKEAIELLEEHKFKYLDNIIGITPRNRRWRGEQILDWIQLNKEKYDIEDYVVVEDEPFDVCGEYCNVIPKEKVIVCDPMKGLTEDKMKEAISKLKEERMKIKLINSKNDFWDIKKMADKNGLIVGGNYPVGGEIEVKVDKELEEFLNRIGYKRVRENDIVIARNGWTLD